jgi:glycosyltransferase involved in cell wall biosynthesis
MRVALVGPYPTDPELAIGGVETSFVNLVHGLSSLGDLDLQVVTFARGARRVRRVDTGAAPVVFLPTRERFNNLELYRTDRHVLRSALDELRPDVVHAQDALGHGYVCLKVARREATVVSIHGIVRETHKTEAGRLGRLQAAVAGVAVERYCVRHARYLLQPTTYPEHYFGAEATGRFVEVGNGVRDAFFAVDPKPERGRVLFAGSVTENKRVLDLLEAVGQLRSGGADVTLRVAGAASDPVYAAKVAARASMLGLDGVLLGPLPAESLIEEYERASLLVLPSAQETSPMVVAEAMAAGLPVVATRVGGVPQLVDDGVTGFLVGVADTTALAQRMSSLLGDEERRQAFGVAARVKAEAAFRCVEVARRVRAVYEQAWRDAAGSSAR